MDLKYQNNNNNSKIKLKRNPEHKYGDTAATLNTLEFKNLLNFNG